MTHLARWLSLGIALVATAPALADPFCLPPSSGVPGMSGPPAWWAGPSPLDDPRWRGAASYNHSGDYARFRALTDTIGTAKYLVLSWEVRADPDAAAGDKLYFGFYNDTGTPATSTGNVFRITRTVGTSTTGGGFAGNLSGKSFYWTGTAWSAVTAVPDFPGWLTTDARVDVTCTSPPATGCDAWAIRLRIPLSATGSFADPASGTGINLGANFRFWYEIKGTAGAVAPTYNFPELILPADYADEDAVPLPSFPDTSKWNLLQPSLTPPCVGGISIEASQITVTKVPAQAGDIPHQISVTRQNDFHAAPQNKTGGSLGGAAIQASFRIADWGSVLFSSPTWRTIPGCSAATGTGSVAHLGFWDLKCSWNLAGTPDACEYNVTPRPAGCTSPPTRNEHQCVLAELKTTPATGQAFFFSASSAYRNMDFVPASKFERVARLDIGGLAAGPDPQRDVYVYVQARNMPAQIQPPAPQPDAATQGGGDVGVRARAELPRGQIGSKEAERIKQLLDAGQINYGDIEKVMPTYNVYVWYDTGRTTRPGGGGTAKVLQAMPGFGYFVFHDGQLTGWEHTLTGAGITPIGPNFYRIGVPHNGSVNVTTTIVAKDGGVTGSHWWLILLLILLALVVLFLVLKKKAP
jgi:hypothetical protein